MLHHSISLADRRLDGRLVERVARPPVDLSKVRVVRVRALAASAERRHRVPQLHSILADLAAHIPISADDEQLGARSDLHPHIAAAMTTSDEGEAGRSSQERRRRQWRRRRHEHDQWRRRRMQLQT